MLILFMNFNQIISRIEIYSNNQKISALIIDAVYLIHSYLSKCSELVCVSSDYTKSNFV